MKSEPIYIKDSILQTTPLTVQGDIITIDDEQYYKISNYDLMAPFLMNIVSDSDLWMFISSNGALTAGRRNPDNALFPYYTDDRIHDSNDITGSKTIIILNRKGNSYLWEPFSQKYQGIYLLKRNIYKNMIGNRVIFEEINFDLNISFQYSWCNCDRFGFIKKSRVVNNSPDTVTVKLLDGIQNILPAEIDRKLQLEYSTLIDGYKKSEFHADLGLAAYMLSSILTDKAEPSESLRTNTVWSTGLENAKILLSTSQLDKFRADESLDQEIDIRAKRGAYFLYSNLELQENQEKQWYIAADVNKDQSQFVALSEFINSNDTHLQQIEDEISKDSENLKIKIAGADGFQLTSDTTNIFRHCSNALFNIMRGGIFNRGYIIDKNDFWLFIEKANTKIANKYESLIQGLPDRFVLGELFNHFADPDPGFEKILKEYLPLTFSRRHGDPSRPWNQFSIDIRDEQGNKKLDYQGNWRDIFQNWEALALSFPDYIESMITKFVNASTADGYNPYRIMRDGIDWEVIDTDDPWSYIGYWGDHQIIYLLKLLELSVNYHPGKLQSLLTREIFTYAYVPYKIKSYEEILQDPHTTINFDFEMDAAIQEKVKILGTDGKLVQDGHGEIYQVNLTEKLLIPLLTKFSNFIPEAGIWMNTQRPEWNDANNALVGYGASMVTLYYMRRFVIFCNDFFNASTVKQFEISEEVFELFSQLINGLTKYQDLLYDKISDRVRKSILDALGQAGSDYRQKIYANGFSGQLKSLSKPQLLEFFQLGLHYIDHSIEANKRSDHLYHAYNLISITNQNEISIRPLYEMLEGQVAILSSGYLSFDDSIILLDSLRKSTLFRKDQFSYLLYPNRDLPRFNEKNIIPKANVKRSKVLKALVEEGDQNLIVKDASGNFHFKANFHNARILKETLDELKYNNQKLEKEEIKLILEIYESVFDHQSFTGRSGTFYKYEGLGSIYWHMVSKLRLAVQETFYRALDSNADLSVLQKLQKHYNEITEGIGSHKNPQLYGAFTTDAYSHTPENSGAQQPGMTGQVKEDIISRFGELGVRITNGRIGFSQSLLKKDEFLIQSQSFNYYDVNNKLQTIPLNKGMLAFTICQVPVIYISGDKERIIITMRDGAQEQIEGHEMGAAPSESIFQRKDLIQKVQVFIDI